MRLAVPVIVVGLFGETLLGQPSSHPPVIDVHVHSTNTTPQRTIERMKQLNIRYVVLSALAPDLAAWRAALPPSEFAAGLVFPCDHGHAVYFGPRACFDDPTAEFPDVEWLRGELRAGRVKAFGELEPQYVGLSPADPRMEPFWQLAEEFDVPVGIHMGTAPAAIAYESSPLPPPVKSPKYRVALGDPLLLEEVLVKHQHLRVWVMHAGWPRLESMIALMAVHPGVYVDVAALQSELVLPHAAYARHLRGLIEAGFGKRIMYGSDFPNDAAAGIDAIQSADFLSAEQKSDILCGNAARFLRLNPSPCTP